MIIREGGEYNLASYYDEDTLALIVSQEHDGADSDQDVQYMGAEDVDQYLSLIAL